MTKPALVLLPGLKHAADQWGAIEPGLASTFRLLTPDLDFSTPAATPFRLDEAADSVTAALDAADVTRATVCGIGLGAMVALQLAAVHPDRVGRLVLVPRQVALSPLLLSLPAVVLRLLPATTVARLGADRPQLLALLDQVRPVDATPLAIRVAAPALVICGARDRLNRRASQTLARALPAGELRLLPSAGPRWVTDSPALLADVLTSVGRTG